MTDFALKIGTSSYEGWKSLQLTRSIEQLAHSFNVSYTDQWAEKGKKIPIRAGDAHKLAYNGRTVTAGWVDEDDLDYDANSRTLGFAGRSKTADLVDCAALYKGGKWRNKTLLDIAKDICEPFDISVKANVDVGDPFGGPDHFSLTLGETAFEAINRGARARGVLLMTDSDGNLVIDRAGETKLKAVIERGKNILRGNRKRSLQDRFSSYTLFGQTSADDNLFGTQCNVSRTASDADVTRYRPIVIQGDGEPNGSALQTRANWERNVRAGRAVRVSYIVQGWEYADGKLWEPNNIVRVIDPDAELDDELLITETVHTRDEGGTKTSITLTAKEAFEVEALPTKKKKKGLFS